MNKYNLKKLLFHSVTWKIFQNIEMFLFNTDIKNVV